MNDARRLGATDLAAALRDSRAVLLSRVLDLDDAQWRVPRQAGINPVAWELGHVAWFAEFWVLRGPHRADADGRVQAAQAARLAGPDDRYDSARLAHAARWDIEDVPRQALVDRLARQLDACIAALPADGDDAALYMHRLALFHEDMHAEAFAWLRGALGHAAPAGCTLPPCSATGERRFEGGAVTLGRPAGQAGFAFDNEQPARRTVLQPFRIDAAPVDAGAYLRFVESGGYTTAAWWPGEAGAWRARAAATHPARWRPREGGRWELRWFDRWQDLDPAQPVVHVNAWEAEAYCRWAGRRLPSAAEWEFAARHDAGAGGFEWGRSVWEWTATPFAPYPGFVPGPYKDYSAPWFGDHRELRGGSFATHARLHDARYRNFFLPQRSDVFTGFRSAAA